MNSGIILSYSSVDRLEYKIRYMLTHVVTHAYSQDRRNKFVVGVKGLTGHQLMALELEYGPLQYCDFDEDFKILRGERHVKL